MKPGPYDMPGAPIRHDHIALAPRAARGDTSRPQARDTSPSSSSDASPSPAADEDTSRPPPGIVCSARLP